MTRNIESFKSEYFDELMKNFLSAEKYGATLFFQTKTIMNFMRLKKKELENLGFEVEQTTEKVES